MINKKVIFKITLNIVIVLTTVFSEGSTIAFAQSSLDANQINGIDISDALKFSPDNEGTRNVNAILSSSSIDVERTSNENTQNVFNLEESTYDLSDTLLLYDGNAESAGTINFRKIAEFYGVKWAGFNLT